MNWQSHMKKNKNMNKLILPFEKLTSKDVGLAGGKGASLGEMTQAGIPVPPGFVILSESFERFIKETDLVQEIDTILHKVNHKEIHKVEAASEEIRELILNAEMPKDIANEIHKSFKVPPKKLCWNFVGSGHETTPINTNYRQIMSGACCF